MTVNELILEAQIKHSVFLERYKSGVLKQIVGLLNSTEEDLIILIASRLTAIEIRGFDLSASETKRLEKLLREIRAKRESVYNILEDRLLEEMQDFGEYEADFQIRLAENAGVQAAFTAPSNVQLKAIVTSQPFRGRLLKDWAAGLQQEEFKRLNDAIRIGITEGQTTDQIVRRIRGTKLTRYQDGMLEISRRDAQAVVSTAVSHVANRARAELYYANADIVNKLQYVATLDSRTTILCASRDGKVYELGKEPTLPAHFRCRSVLVAYFDVDEAGDRASVVGPIPAKTTFSEFLKKQGREFQDEVLGVERAKQFRAGTPLEKFVDKSGHVYTLKELKAREI